MYLDNEYFLISMCIFILIIYLILPLPKIIFKIDNKKFNIKMHKCKK